LVLVTDSGFSALEFPAALRRQEIPCVTRLRFDAALYRPAPPRRPSTIGRPLTKGDRLLTLAGVLANKTTRWQWVPVPGWYGEGDPIVEICSDTAVWRHAGMPVVPIRSASNWQARAKQGYEQRDFTVDWEQEQVICPQGKASVTWSTGRDEAGAPPYAGGIQPPRLPSLRGQGALHHGEKSDAAPSTSIPARNTRH
jgi:hypothetical protein